MKSKLKSNLAKAVRIAKTIWEIPAIQSRAITWLVRLGVPGAALLPLVIDAVWPR